MTERAAFIRAIISEPDDDTARLVFADWLEENGEKERGEFIRAQVAAFNGAKLDSMQLWDLLHHSEGWFAEVNQALRIEPNKWGVCYDSAVHYECKHHTNEFYVRRGFVSSITLSQSEFFKHARVLFASQPVTRVTLTGRAPQPVGEHTWVWLVRRDSELPTERQSPSMWLVNEFRHHLKRHRNPKRCQSRGRSYHRFTYPTSEAAHEDLAAACVRYGRWRANLPPLPLPVA